MLCWRSIGSACAGREAEAVRLEKNARRMGFGSMWRCTDPLAGVFVCGMVVVEVVVVVVVVSPDVCARAAAPMPHAPHPTPHTP